MNNLRLEAEEAQEKVEELKSKVKTLEQENLAKEQEITSLNHRNQLLEGEVEKLETALKEAKDSANQSAQHDTQNEALQRRLQLLEEEAEDADRNLRETNEKYVYFPNPPPPPPRTSFLMSPQRSDAYTDYAGALGSAKPTSRLATTNARCRLSKRLVTSGRASTRRWRRNTPSCRRICTTSRSPSAMFKKEMAPRPGRCWIQPFPKYTFTLLSFLHITV